MFSAFWLVGLWLGHIGWVASEWIIVVSTACPVLICWLSAGKNQKGLPSFAQNVNRSLLVATIIPLGLGLGLIYGYHSVVRYQVLDQLIDSKVTIEGTIIDDPATKDKGTTSFTVGSLSYGQAIPGSISVNTYSSKYQRGYRVQLSGKLQSTLGSKQARMYATVTTLSSNQSWLERLRQRFIASVNSQLPEPLNGFALGLLIGARSLIPKFLQDQLAVVGLSHLVAVSGYNLTIIVDLFKRSSKGVSRYVTLAAAFWLITGFVAVSGASASIVRAALVSVFSLSAYHFGRQIKPWVLVAVPAVATTFWRPDYLWADVGWQLSFLAFIGILVAAPRFHARLKRPNWFKRLVIDAACAQVLTFPVILAVFHQFSAVGVLANALVLPLVPFAMMASFITGAVGMIFPSLGVMAWPAFVVLKLMIWLITRLGAVPWASLNLQVSPAMIELVYLSLFLAIISLGRRSRAEQISDGIIAENN